MSDNAFAGQSPVSRVSVRPLAAADGDELIALGEASREFHHPWLDLPKTREQFEEYFQRRQAAADQCYVICDRSTGRIVGGINLSCIVRGCFQSACLGYWIGAPFARQGYMEEAVRLLSRYAFSNLGLHRLEANIQPENTASIALVRKCGFRCEGYSPRYLRVGGEWRDHERWALLAEDAKEWVIGCRGAAAALASPL